MPAFHSEVKTIYQRPVELLQTLIRFDTTNPPGNEAACIGYINHLLTDAGLQTRILARDPLRPNLICRLRGEGLAPPLLLYGHIDVVTTSGQTWTYPPFEAAEAEGFIWGRGALDMKGGVAMLLSSILRARAEGYQPAGDLVLAILSDEEAAGDQGAKFLVEEHPEEFAGIRYALSEAGGASTTIAGHKFYPIQVAEKQLCWMKARFSGPGGHGSRPVRGGAMAKLGRFLIALDKQRLPVHVIPLMADIVEQIAGQVAEPEGQGVRQLLDPRQTDSTLDELGPKVKMLDALLHNTVSPTVVRAGEKVNVIPSTVEVELDGRLLPDYGPEDMLAEVQAVAGSEATLEIIRNDPSPYVPDLGWFDGLAKILTELDPSGTPIPMMLAGVTDARFFNRLGIQTYGFLPLDLPADFDASSLVHAADERVPAESIIFGSQAVYMAVQRYGRWDSLGSNRM